MKYILILMCFISMQAYSVEWKFEKWQKAGFPDLDGKHLAFVRGTENSKELLGDGLSGQAIRFNGAYHMKINNSDAVSLKNNFTISCTFKPDRTNSYRTLLWKGNRNLKPQQINYYLSFKDGKPEFKFKERDGAWVVIGSLKPLIEAGKWYYLVVTMDSKGLITGYLNGKQCFQKLYKPGTLVTNRQPAYIGAGESFYGGGIGYPFSGLIDRVTISSGVNPPSAEKLAEFKRLAKFYMKKRDSARKLKRQAYIKIIETTDIPNDTLSKMTIDELKALVDKVKYRKFFLDNADNSKIIVSVLPTAQRILSVNDYSSGKFKLKNKAVLSAARNEYEGFQLILLGNPHEDIENLKITVSKLKSSSGNVIPENKLEFGFIRPIKTSKPKYDVDYVGDYPDAIMEGQTGSIAIPRNGFVPIYIRVRIDDNIAVGEYNGTIRIFLNSTSKLVPVKLTVYDFTLPVKTSCKAIFSFFEGDYRKWYGKQVLSDKEKMYIYDFLLKYRITPNNIYSKGIYPELRFIPELKSKGANFYTLGYLFRKQPVGPKELNEIVTTYRKRIDLLKKAGLEQDTYLYAFDEVGDQSEMKKQAARQIMTAIRKEFPGLKTIQTSSPQPGLLDCFNVWVPLFSYFPNHKRQIRELKKNGNKFWWYCADSPLMPYPNFFLDYPVFNSRIIMTLSYVYGIKGVLYWSINREWSTNLGIRGQWPGKRWKPHIINRINGKRQYKNGMGNLVYPGLDGRILPSLRLENLRDGIEDYEYLTLLKKLTANCRDKKLANEAKKLLKVPANVALAVNNYSTNPNDLIKYRNDIALMIEKLNRSSK